AEAGGQSSLRIELPSGSYIPEFKMVHPIVSAVAAMPVAPTPAVTPAEVLPELLKPDRRWRYAAVFAIVGLAIIPVLWVIAKRPQGAPPPATRVLPWSLLLTPARDLRIILC